jgi:transcriptional regulator of acetoin/glycerol metabolism
VVSKGPEIDLNELPPYILNNPDKGNRAFSKDLSSFSVSYSHNSATEDKRDLSYEQKQASLKILKDPARLEKLLVECDWNKAEAGRRLKKSRTAVWKWMKKHNLPMFDPAIEKS